MTRFGDFEDICLKTAFPFCSVVSSSSNDDTYFPNRIMTTCYARAVELSNTMIYQIGNAIINIGGLLVCLIIIFNIRSKYTAIARSEMLVFFYQFTALLIVTLICDCGVAPPGKAIYSYFVAAQIAFAASCCWNLVFVGFLCFQLWEDGTRRSMLSLNISSFAIWAANFLIAIFTFRDWAGTSFSTTNTTGLFSVMYIINAIFVGVYVFSQVILATCVLSNYWALGSILLGSFFFIVAQIVVYLFSEEICHRLNHYLDGLFFGSLFNIFAIMMIYKYWDIITTEDLEFSVLAQEAGVALNQNDANDKNQYNRHDSRYFSRNHDMEEKSLLG